jgi:hypothetical protein
MGACSTFKGTLNAPSISDRHLKALDGTPHRELAMSADIRAGKVNTDAFLEAPNRPGTH